MDGNHTPIVFVKLCARHERGLSARWGGHRFAAARRRTLLGRYPSYSFRDTLGLLSLMFDVAVFPLATLRTGARTAEGADTYPDAWLCFGSRTP